MRGMSKWRHGWPSSLQAALQCPLRRLAWFLIRLVFSEQCITSVAITSSSVQVSSHTHFQHHKCVPPLLKRQKGSLLRIPSQKTEESCFFLSPTTHSSIRWKTQGRSGKILGWVFTVGCQKAAATAPGLGSHWQHLHASPSPRPRVHWDILRSWAGDKGLLPLLQGSARAELLISTTHQHDCCSLQITF